MEIEIVQTCPLGSKCEEVVDGKIHRCNWFIKLEGKSPQTGKDIDEWRCAIAWQPILAIEQSMQMRGVAVSVQEAGNRSLVQQQEAIKVLNNGKDITTG